MTTTNEAIALIIELAAQCEDEYNSLKADYDAEGDHDISDADLWRLAVFNVVNEHNLSENHGTDPNIGALATTSSGTNILVEAICRHRSQLAALNS
jgi:hypothetical protein